MAKVADFGLASDVSKEGEYIKSTEVFLDLFYTLFENPMIIHKHIARSMYFPARLAITKSQAADIVISSNLFRRVQYCTWSSKGTFEFANERIGDLVASPYKLIVKVEVSRAA